MNDPAAGWSPGLVALYAAGLAITFAIYALLSLVVGARYVVGRLASERLADEAGLAEPLDPGSRTWSAVAAVRQAALLGVVMLAGFGPFAWCGVIAAGAAGVTAIVAGRLSESLAAPLAPERTLRTAAPLLAALSAVLGPFVAPLARRHEALVTRGRRTRATVDEDARDEQIEEVIREAEEEGLIEEEQGDLLREIVDAGAMVVREVMTPRPEIDAVATETPPDELAAAFVRSRHSRLLVYEGTLDKVVGVVAVRDLLPHLSDGSGAAAGLAARDLMRPVPLVPQTKKVLELLREMQDERQQIAAVVDEYGGTAGLVTLEDLLEEIVGDIRDEHELDAVRDDGRGGIVADGLTPLDELAAELGVDLGEQEVETVGGLVFTALGRLPRVGDHVALAGGARCEVVRMSGRRVALVRVTRPAASETERTS